MPGTYGNSDMILELKSELKLARDMLLAEVRAHKRTQESREWYRKRVDMLQRAQSTMREPERTLVCDIIANCGLMPDPRGQRYEGLTSEDIKRIEGR